MKKARVTSPRPIAISNFDRVNAMVRNPQYLEDLQQATMRKGKKFFSLPRQEALKKKYGLVGGLLVDRQFVESHSMEELESLPLFEKDRAVRVLTPWKRKTLDVERTQFGDAEVEDFKDELRPLLRQGRYLSIEVDLTKRKNEDILPGISKIWDDYVRYAIKPSKAGNIESHWEVWDKHHVEGKSLLQVTRELFGVQGSPPYDFPTAHYRTVQRAYQKASKIIKAVTPTMN